MGVGAGQHTGAAQYRAVRSKTKGSVARDSILIFLPRDAYTPLVHILRVSAWYQPAFVTTCYMYSVVTSRLHSRNRNLVNQRFRRHREGWPSAILLNGGQGECGGGAWPTNRFPQRAKRCGL